MTDLEKVETQTHVIFQTLLLCISTSQQVLLTPFTGQNTLFQGFNNLSHQKEEKR